MWRAKSSLSIMWSLNNNTTYSWLSGINKSRSPWVPSWDPSCLDGEMSLPLCANVESWSCPYELWDSCEGQMELACNCFTSLLLEGLGMGLRRSVASASQPRRVSLAFLEKGGVVLSELLDVVPSGATSSIPRDAVLVIAEECWMTACFFAPGSCNGNFLLRAWWVKVGPFLSDELQDGPLRPLDWAEAVVPAVGPFWVAPDALVGADLVK